MYSSPVLPARLTRVFAFLSLVAVVGSVLSAAPPASAPAKPGMTILSAAPFFGRDWDAGTTWRYYETWQNDVARTEDGKLVTVNLSDPRKKLDTAADDKAQFAVNPATKVYGSPPPPEGWQKAEFDDSSWIRHGGPFANYYRCLSRICLRGKFQVSDPAGVSDLTFSAKFQGGLVVYLNGQEVGRASMPEGKLDAETLAEPYPLQAYVDSKGKLLVQPPYNQFVLAAGRAWGVWGPLSDKETLENFKYRCRSAEIKIPAAALKKGANVLALELRRSPAEPVMFTKTQLKLGAFPDFSVCWNRCALEEATLAASAAAGAITPNAARPAGLQVWNEDNCARIDSLRYGDPSETLKPIRLFGMKNGSYAGRVVVGAKAIDGLKATVTDLAGKDGVQIPAAAIHVAFGNSLSDAMDTAPPSKVPTPTSLPGSYGKIVTPAGQGQAVVDAVGAVVPVWVTVQVPRDASAGTYSGTLNISADGTPPIAVPVELKVIGNWALPDPQNFTTFIAVHESSDSVAMYYDLPLWSEEHWKHLDKVYELLAQIGTKDLYLPVIAKTHLANKESLVRWIKQPDGSYTHDFTNFEKYLDIALKHLGKPPVVCLYLHDYGFRGESDKRTPVIPCVTLLDPKTGQTSDLNTPDWGTPEAAAFWKPVIDKARQLVAKRGLAKSFMFGMGANNLVKTECLQDLKAWYPDVPWVNRTHYTAGNPPQVQAGNLKQPAALSAVAMGAISVIYDPAEEPIHPGWKTPELILNFARWDGARGKVFGRDVQTYRLFAEGALLTGGMTEGKYQIQGSRGVGHIGADYWPVMKDPKGGPAKDMTDRYTFWHSLSLSDMVHDIIAPGIKGPVATARLQMMRESLQDAEAMILIENALLDPAATARLGDDLAKRCKETCDERIRMLRHFSVFCGYGQCEDYARVFPISRWLELSEKMYGLAEEVDKTLSKK